MSTEVALPLQSFALCKVHEAEKEILLWLLLTFSICKIQEMQSTHSLSRFSGNSAIRILNILLFLHILIRESDDIISIYSKVCKAN